VGDVIPRIVAVVKEHVDVDSRNKTTHKQKTINGDL
jgi:hypothetical protein